MTAAPVAPTDLEERAGVDSLDALQQKRRELLKDYAPLAAKWSGGSNRIIDALRKQHRAIVSKKILSEWKETSKPAENALERMANSTEEHVQYVQDIIAEGVEYVRLQNSITEIEERIQSRLTELSTYNAELRLAR